MAIKIKRCLYVGLGGTGMNALLHTKKMFVETYGEVPPMIGFLGIDTDGDAYKKELPSKYGPVSLAPNEQTPIQVEDAQASYVTSRQHFGWVHPDNVFALTSMTKGAGQIRSNGRFALTCNFETLANKVRDAVGRITAANIKSNPKYDADFVGDVEVHMVFSMSGGTGAGTFINMAYVIRHALGKCKLTGYAVLPDVFECMSQYGMERVKPNTYGSIIDLDYFMHLSGTEGLQFDYVTSTQDVKSRPFSAFFFIDNKNKGGDSYSNIDQLTEMISLALVTSSGELSGSVDSVTDNVEKSIMNGDGMVGNKRAWVSGMGACEILFRGKDMCEINALKNAQRIIQRMVSSCQDANMIVNNWIDSPEVNIRENGGSENDNVIDFLLPKNPKYPLEDIDDDMAAESSVNAFIETVRPRDEEVQNKVLELKDRVLVELHKLVVKSINQECGVGLANDVLDGLLSQVNLFLGEMNEEKDKLSEIQPRLQNAIKVACADLKDISGRFFKKKSTVEDLRLGVCDAGMALAVNIRELKRRDGAITFFSALIQAINEEKLKVIDIENKLKAVNTTFTNRITALQNNVSRTNAASFQIDLAKQAINTIVINDDEIQIVDFLNKLPYTEKFYEIGTKPTEEIENALMGYTLTLPTAKKWASTTIDDVMKKMDKENPEELDRILRMALTKASPLLNINTRGEVGYRVAHFTYVGVPMDSNILEEDGRLERLAGGEKINFTRLGMNDRVIIYNQIGVVPAYFIGSLENYRQKYKNSTIFSHFDYNLYNRMMKEHFSLEPIKEDGSRDVEMWVRGFVFGLIKNENGKYYVKNKNTGKALLDYWVELATYRNDAFNAFVADSFTLRPQFKEYITSWQKNNGQDAMKQLRADVKANYRDKYSQLFMDNEELLSRGNEQVAELMEKELRFIETLE
ncbi:MAG: tubulin-like doman-containing protein [Prevotella sp.]|nr:tubulin-like doman-containing protein [Prevotella sp.]